MSSGQRRPGQRDRWRAPQVEIDGRILGALLAGFVRVPRLGLVLLAGVAAVSMRRRRADVADDIGDDIGEATVVPLRSTVPAPALAAA